MEAAGLDFSAGFLGAFSEVGDEAAVFSFSTDALYGLFEANKG